MASFADAVKAWRDKANARVEATFKTAAQSLVTEMLTPVSDGGHMPTRTGFLRSSLVASNADMPKIDPTARPGDEVTGLAYFPDVSQANLVIASTGIKDTLYLGFTASYGKYQEAKHQFVGLAAQRWPTIVNNAAAGVKQAVSRGQ